MSLLTADNDRTFLIAIGVGRSTIPNYTPLLFASQEALSFFNTIRRVESVSPEAACLLTDEGADYASVHAALDHVFLREAKAGDRIIFYYSGHARLDPRQHTAYLTLHTPRGRCLGINLRELRALIEDSHATTVLAYIDACHSGAINQEKHNLASNLLNFKQLSLQSAGA